LQITTASCKNKVFDIQIKKVLVFLGSKFGMFTENENCASPKKQKRTTSKLPENQPLKNWCFSSVALVITTYDHSTCFFKSSGITSCLKLQFRWFLHFLFWLFIMLPACFCVQFTGPKMR